MKTMFSTHESDAYTRDETKIPVLPIFEIIKLYMHPQVNGVELIVSKTGRSIQHTIFLLLCGWKSGYKWEGQNVRRSGLFYEHFPAYSTVG